MSKAKESVADIIARRKKEKATPKTTKKTKKSKPATKKAGVVVGKNEKISTQKNSKRITPEKTGLKGIVNLKNPEVYQEFIKFIATLPNFRKLQTQGEFSQEFGVGEETLSAWKKRDGFWDDVREERKQSMKDNMVSNILMAVYRKVVKEGSSKEAKLLLEIAGEYEEKKIIDNRIKTVSPEQAEDIAKRVKMWTEGMDDDDEDETPDEE